MPTRNVVLTNHQAAMVAMLVDSGRYQNASEVIREGLRLIERRETEADIRLTALREAVAVGIADIGAGRFQEFDTAETMRERLSVVATEVLVDRLPRGDAD